MDEAAQLLNEVRVFIARFCVFPSQAALDAVTLWVVHAHMVQHFHTTPRLALLSPEPESGKTRVLEVLELLAPEPMLVLSPSAPTIFRSLSKCQITLLFDEVDTIFTTRGKNDQYQDLRGLLNSGYKKGATIPRCVGPTHDVRRFPTFAAVALAGIGHLPDTIMTRAVVIRMRRRSARERVEPFRSRLHQEAGHALRDRLSEWANEVGEKAGNAWPVLPVGVEDRRAEIWEPLIAVADQAGGHWPDTARKAAVELCGQAAERPISLGLRLLTDLKTVFADDDKLATVEILDRLCGEKPFGVDQNGEPLCIDDDAPWGDLRGKPLDSRGLARMLKKYDVAPMKVKVPVEGAKRPLQGYQQNDLWDVWQRYLPETPVQAEPPELPEPPDTIMDSEEPGSSAGSGSSVYAGSGGTTTKREVIEI